MSGGCGYPAGLHGGGGPLLALHRHPAPSSLPPAGRRCPIIPSSHPGQHSLHISVSAGLLFVPESPIWLLGHRGEEEAARALRWLRSGEGEDLKLSKLTPQYLLELEMKVKQRFAKISQLVRLVSIVSY